MKAISPHLPRFRSQPVILFQRFKTQVTLIFFLLTVPAAFDVIDGADVGGDVFRAKGRQAGLEKCLLEGIMPSRRTRAPTHLLGGPPPPTRTTRSPSAVAAARAPARAEAAPSRPTPPR